MFAYRMRMLVLLTILTMSCAMMAWPPLWSGHLSADAAREQRYGSSGRYESLGVLRRLAGRQRAGQVEALAGRAVTLSEQAPDRAVEILGDALGGRIDDALARMDEQ